MGDGRNDGDPIGSDPSIDLEWVSDNDDLGPSRRRRFRPIGAAVVALVCVVGVAVAVVATRPDDDDRSSRGTVETAARRALVAALGKTTASGSYNTTNEFMFTPGSASPQACTDAGVSGENGPELCFAGQYPAVTATGRSTVNTDPYRMVAVSDVSALGAITTYVDGTRVWEDGGGNYGITAPGIGPGGSLSGFAGLVLGSLGPGPGSLTMLTLASPNGYLNLQEQAVVGVTPWGTLGTGITYFDVAIDVGKLLDVPGLTPEQVKTISTAIEQLGRSGYRGTTVRVGVDAEGFIRETISTSEFEGGARVTSHTVLSNFGCAGLVRLPGEPPPPPPPPCPATEPTTTTAPTTTTTLHATTTTSAPPDVSSTTTTTRAPADESVTTTTSSSAAPGEPEGG